MSFAGKFHDAIRGICELYGVSWWPTVIKADELYFDHPRRAVRLKVVKDVICLTVGAPKHLPSGSLKDPTTQHIASSITRAYPSKHVWFYFKLALQWYQADPDGLDTEEYQEHADNVFMACSTEDLEYIDYLKEKWGTPGFEDFVQHGHEFPIDERIIEEVTCQLSQLGI